MPKVFLTGSNVTRGYVTGSGFITLPPRVMIRQKDARTGSYPTIKRIGDVSRQGNYTVNFDDSNTINFNTPYATAEIAFLGRRTDSLNQIRPSPNSLITLRGTSGQVKTFEFVYSGSSTSNASYQAVEMPYIAITSTDLLPQGAVLEIENRKIAKSFVEAVNNSNLRIKAKLKAFTGPTRPDKSKNYIRSLIPKHAVDYVDNLALSGIAHSSNYYVILEQELPGSGGNLSITTSSVLTSDDRVIGLSTPATFTGGKSNQVYPSLGLTSNYQKFLSQSHASPNFLDTNLLGTGRTLPGVSDAHIEFTPGEDLLPFDESRINITDDIFFNQGVSPDVIPGFAYKLGDKTQITYDLSPSTATSFGYTKKLHGANGYNSFPDGQLLMVYWNNQLKRWEKIGRPINSNYGGGLQGLKDLMTGSCLGFSSLYTIASSSTSDTILSNLHDEDFLSSIGKPIDTFGFPFGPQYHATSSQVVTAREMGINSPMLLEKLSLNFTANLGVYSHFNVTGPSSADLFNSTFTYPKSAIASSRAFRTIMPTFFILRQRRDSFERQISLVEKTASTETRSPEITVNIPVNNHALVSGSNNTNRIETNRDLVTFGQMTIIASCSNTIAEYSDQFSFTIKDILDGGLSRDLDFPLTDYFDLSDTSLTKSLTGSFTMNFPCRNTPRREPSNELRLFSPVGTPIIYKTQNDSGARSSGLLSDDNRAIVNLKSSLTPSNKNIFLPSRLSSNDPIKQTIPDKSSSDQISPYLILPDDKLIFGWQYPAHGDLREDVGSSDKPFYFMTLYDKSQLTLFGSQLRNNEEFHDTLNQPLNSDAIHEAIHYDNPVVDQFDIETAYEYSGSYITRARGGDDVTTLTGDEVSGRKTYLGHNISTVTEPHLSSSFNRFVKMENFKEKFYDSFVPDVIETAETAGFSIELTTITTPKLRTINLTGHEKRSPEAFFPFELNLNKKNKLDNLNLSDGFLNNARINLKTAGDSSTVTNNYIKKIDKPDSFASNNRSNANFLLFGYSTQSPGGVPRSLNQKANTNRSTVPDPGIPLPQNTFFVEYEISGFRYGLINAVPQSTTSVFRRDRYGQFRDMLEQRLDSKFLNVRSEYQHNPNPDFSLSNSFEHSVQNDSSLIYEKSPNPSPIKVLFASGTNTGGSLGTIYNVIPDIQLEIDSNPFFQSSNINTECTSSLPFFDDDTPRNRNYPAEFI